MALTAIYCFHLLVISLISKSLFYNITIERKALCLRIWIIAYGENVNSFARKDTDDDRVESKAYVKHYIASLCNNIFVWDICDYE
jgi:hypothetical protein